MAHPPGAGWLLRDFNLKRLSRNPRSIFGMSVSHRGREGIPRWVPNPPMTAPPPCEVDTKAVAAALVAAGHFGAGVAEMFLHVALIDLGVGGEAGAQRMSGEFSSPLSLGEIAAHARCQRGFSSPAARCACRSGDRRRRSCRQRARAGTADPGRSGRISIGFPGRRRDRRDRWGPAQFPTSRQPVFPRMVTSAPFSKISIQPLPSRVCAAAQSRPTISERRMPASRSSRTPDCSVGRAKRCWAATRWRQI